MAIGGSHVGRRRIAIAMVSAIVAVVVVAPVWAQAKSAQKFPDVLSAKVTPRGATFDFDVTISSPYDTPQRYADAFRVLAPDGKVLGERILFHDHADEQPFTRDLHGVAIPAGIGVVRIEGRDKQYGYGGKSITVALPGR